MATRPSTFLNWLGGSATPPSQYLTQPPGGQLATGWLSGQPGPFQYENYILWLLDQWIQYLDNTGFEPTSVTLTLGTSQVYAVLPPTTVVFIIGTTAGGVVIPDSVGNPDYQVTIKNISYGNPTYVLGVSPATGTDKIENGTAGAGISLSLGQSVTLHSDGAGNYWMVSP